MSQDYQWEQFCRLGEMIGDGLHHEEPWISKEYSKLAKILLPPTKEEKEIKRKLRKEKNQQINEMIQMKLTKDKCQCGGNLKQTRSGSMTVVCENQQCLKKYRYKKRRN